MHSSAPLCCRHCFQEFEKIYLSEHREVLYINPPSVFKKRYITRYGELILPEEHSDAEFIPALDPAKRIKTTYIESFAYMLYSSGIKADKLKMLIDRYECILYDGGTIIDALLYEDMNHVSRNTFRNYMKRFDKILAAMLEMEKGDFIYMRG
jgi:hypothetical protein